MRTYWTMVIIQDSDDSEPWLCSAYDSCKTLKEAKEQIKFYETNFRCICSWIQSRDDSKKSYQNINLKYYVNSLGYKERRK